MSAIAGAWTRGTAPDPRSACERMLAAQTIYGPHACDQWDGGEVSLGRRLFRTLPEDIHDRQPLIGGGGRLALVADLRLDNREDLEAALNISRAVARQTCDASILLAAWERWGEDCLDRLVGYYAFALWDQGRGALVLARDILGHRPLHYHRGDGFFAFASMPKGLHALEEVPRAPDEARARDFLAMMPEHGTRSFFAGVERVEPGCLVTVTSDGFHSRRHWRPERRPIKLAGPDDYVQAAREHLDRAVRAQLRGAEGVVGAHLSAGLDSSGVAATAARLMAPIGGQVVAFTSVPRQGYRSVAIGTRLVDEGPLAAATTALYPNMDHVLVRPTGRPPTEALDRDFRLYDRPLRNLCNVGWVAEINRQARDRGLSIMLVGSVGNASLSYNGMDLLPELLAHGRLVHWFAQAGKVVRTGTKRWRGVAFHSLGPWMPGPIWRWLERIRGVSGLGLEEYTALNPALTAGLDLARRANVAGIDPFDRPGADTFASRMSHLRSVDVGNYRKGALGGWGIDERDPLADRRLIEFCLNIPAEQFIADGRPRSLARRALADRLPAAVVCSQGFGYQAADWHEDLAAGRADLGDWIARLEDSPPAASALDLPRLRRLVENWPTGGWERVDVVFQYRIALLRGLSVGHFLHRASGSNS